MPSIINSLTRIINTHRAALIPGKRPAVVDQRNAVRNLEGIGSFEMEYRCDVNDHDNNTEYYQVWSTMFPNLAEATTNENCPCQFNRQETFGELVKTKFGLATESIVVPW